MGPISGNPADVASESDTTGVADTFASDTGPKDITDTSAPSDAQAPRVDISTLDDVLEDAADIELSDAILLDTLDGAELPSDAMRSDIFESDTGVIESDSAGTEDTESIEDSAGLDDIGPSADTDSDDDPDTLLIGDALGTMESDGPVVILDMDKPVEGALFPLGVSAGAARAESIIFWTKYTGSDEVRLTVWRPLDIPNQVVKAYDEVVTPADGGFIKLRVDGLLPDARYEYAFVLENQKSPTGSARTALAPGAKRPITFAATSCTSQFYQPWPALSLMADYDVDAVLHAGDMSYNDGAVTLEEYREAWADTLSQTGYRDLLSAAGLYATWDDHEVDNNWDPETMDPSNIAAAKQAFFETLPNDQGPEARLWERYQWGDALELFILDCRAERKPSTAGNSPEPDIYISQAQMDWLKDGLFNSTATYKVILNSVPITDMPFFYFGEGDRWEGYPDQRNELLGYIADNDIGGVWFIAGDFHLGFVSWVDTDGSGANIREVAVGPGGNLNPAGLLAGLFPQSQFDFFHGNPETATLLTFDPDNETVFVQFIDANNGDVLIAKEYPGVVAP